MKNRRNVNAPPTADLVQYYIDSAYDNVKLVADNLALLLPLAEAIEGGDLNGLLQVEDIDTLAELNAIVGDAVLTDVNDQATPAQGALAETAIQGPFASQGEAEAGTDNTKAMTPLRVAQAIAVLASGLQNNYSGESPPGPDDDITFGWSIGSYWLDLLNNESYRCVDNTDGAAVWVLTSLTSDELATVALSGNSDDLIEGSNKLLLTPAERAKVLGIEDNATADQTGAEIKSLYEGETDTNAFTDNDKSRLAAMEDDSTADQTNAEITNAYNAEVAIATQGEMEAGTEATVRRMTPEGVKQAITALVPPGGGGGVAWSGSAIDTDVTAGTGTTFQDLTATTYANLPTDPALNDVIWINNNDDSSWQVFINAGGTNDIQYKNIHSVPIYSLEVGETAILICVDAGATKIWSIGVMSLTAASTGGGGGMTALYKDADYTLEANDLVYSEDGLDHTLPASPSEGDKCSVWDASDNAGSNAISIIGGEVYDPGMMTFNGSTGYYDKTGITVSGNAHTAVIRFNRASFTGGGEEIFCHMSQTGVNRLYFRVHASDHASTDRRGKIILFTQNGSGSSICRLISSSVVCDGSDHLIFFSYDATAGTAIFTLDGSDAIDTGWANHLITTGTIDNATQNYGIGASVTGTNHFGGDIGYVGYRTAYLTNYSDFGTGSAPLELDETTWTEWGGQPLFWNAEGEMTDNKGSAGNMTANGTITGPSVPAVVAEQWNLNMNGGRFDFMYDGSKWIYSYVVQTVQPSSVVTRTVRKTLKAGGNLFAPDDAAMVLTTIGDPVFAGVGVTGYAASTVETLRCITELLVKPNMVMANGFKARFTWMHNTAASGDVRFTGRGLALSSGDSLAQSMETDGDTVQTSAGINLLHTSSWIDIAPASIIGATSGDYIQLGFYRTPTNVLDTLGASVYILNVEIEYTTEETI